MLLDEILENISLPSRQTTFVKPPKETYLVWSDDVSMRGADLLPNLVSQHFVDFEVYAYRPDEEAEAKVEAALRNADMEWSKVDRVWVQSEQLYMTSYHFEYLEKE